MTIYELKRRNIANGGMFFDRKTMRAFGDTMKNFGIETVSPSQVRVFRKHENKFGRITGSWIFNTQTGRIDWMIP